MLRRSLLILLLAPALVGAQSILRELHVKIPMRDGTHLCANVFRPAAEGKLPAVLVRTPYGKGNDLPAAYAAFVKAGYAVVIQDVRGRGHSEGEFQPLHQEVNDGYDTLAWIARQSWSNARIGMIGASYLGIVQWKAALSGHPALKAIVPAVSGWDDYEDRFYSKGGALKLGHRLSWLATNLRAPGFSEPNFEEYVRHLPLRTSDRAAAGRTVDFFQAALDHPTYDEFWRAISTREAIERVRIPVLIIAGWYDNFAESDLAAFEWLRKLGRQARIIVGPWPHNLGAKLSTVDFGPQAYLSFQKLQLEWLDRWVKAGAEGKVPAKALPGKPARLFLMGANRWKEYAQWPPPHRLWLLYLAPGSRLAEKPEKGARPASFTYDPHNPVPTMGGAVCCNPKIFPWGPMDQRSIESRPDVLVYTSEPLRRDTEVTGEIRVRLWVATTAPDTDFTAKLVDVWPDGRAINLCDGILRLRYREGLERAVLATPGTVYAITIQAGVTSNLFRKGHRIRLEISSSNFPRFDRNPNTGRLVADETQLVPARQTVYQDAERPSHLILPVVSGG